MAGGRVRKTGRKGRRRRAGAKRHAAQITGSLAESQ